MMDGITKESGGPQPDKLGVKVSGSLPVTLDLKRTQVVRIELEGKVVGHNFADHYDKDGDRDTTTKMAVIKVDELLVIEPIVRAKRSSIPGQQAFEDVDGELSGQDDVRPQENGHAPAEIVEATVVAELEAGDPEAIEEEEDPDLEWR